MTAPVPPESGVDSAPGSAVPAESTGGLSAQMSPSELHHLRVAFDRDHWAGEFNSVPTQVDRLLAGALAARDAEHARHEAAEVARVRAEERERIADRVREFRKGLASTGASTETLTAVDTAELLAREADGEGRACRCSHMGPWVGCPLHGEADGEAGRRG